MAPPQPLYHVQGVQARKGAQTSLSLCSEPPLRSSTRIDMNASPRKKSSSAVLPQLTNSSHDMSGTSFGIANRRSAIRSLANNPNFSAEIVKGRLTFLRRKDTLSADKCLGISPNGKEREISVAVSKEGYHPRSRSPTYQTLLLAKSQLEILLSRKLCDIRRDLDGQKARQNSAVVSGIPIVRETDDLWYVSAINEDEEMSAIETTRLVNEDYASSFETISTAVPLPHRSARFTSKALRENVTNKAILELDIKGEEKKIREWRAKHSTDIPRLERPDSASGQYRRNCFAIPSSAEEKHRFLRRTSRPIDPSFIAPLKRKPKPIKRIKVKEIEAIPAPTIAVPEPIEQEAEPIMEAEDKEPEPEIKIEEEKSERKSLSYIDRQRDEETNSKPIPVLHLNTISETDSENNQSGKPVMNSIDPVPSAKNTDDETGQGKEGLSEKEKFLRMQQRMAQRKLTKQKTRESFADYSYMMFSKNRDKANMSKLGEALSKRLENMSTFKSTLDEDSGDEIDYETQLSSSESDDD
ncbi:hypothetical protein HOLleu_26088 [Holothuria leucospilota]|uniref:Uncharacterized protein n=1 Tax=Holothuria leucospilota TaxID=206669 RepID=A0A9Q1BTE7_HOLLE|nr:hypothetical protein HOLleu_26088 [Holothuria leucospilota]